MSSQFDAAMQSLQQKEMQAQMIKQKHFELACALYVRNVNLRNSEVELPALAKNALTAANVMFQAAGLIEEKDDASDQKSN